MKIKHVINEAPQLTPDQQALLNELQASFRTIVSKQGVDPRIIKNKLVTAGLAAAVSAKLGEKTINREAQTYFSNLFKIDEKKINKRVAMKLLSKFQTASLPADQFYKKVKASSSSQPTVELQKKIDLMTQAGNDESWLAAAYFVKQNEEPFNGMVNYFKDKLQQASQQQPPQQGGTP